LRGLSATAELLVFDVLPTAVSFKALARGFSFLLEYGRLSQKTI